MTTRLRLLTYLAVAPYRNPLLLAKQAATLDRLSGGRLILGLGAGYLKGEFHALGVDFEERNALFDEVLDVLPLHWSGEPFSYEGRHFSARDVVALPRPTQRPIPIWIGGNSRLSRRRAAERAQGWMPMSGGAELSATARTPALGPLSELTRAIDELKEAATAAGRGEALDVLHSYRDEGLTAPPSTRTGTGRRSRHWGLGDLDGRVMPAPVADGDPGVPGVLRHDVRGLIEPPRLRSSPLTTA